MAAKGGKIRQNRAGILPPCGWHFAGVRSPNSRAGLGRCRAGFPATGAPQHHGPGPCRAPCRAGRQAVARRAGYLWHLQSPAWRRVKEQLSPQAPGPPLWLLWGSQGPGDASLEVSTPGWGADVVAGAAARSLPPPAGPPPLCGAVPQAHPGTVADHSGRVPVGHLGQLTGLGGALRHRSLLPHHGPGGCPPPAPSMAGAVDLERRRARLRGRDGFLVAGHPGRGHRWASTSRPPSPWTGRSASEHQPGCEARSLRWATREPARETGR